ncbi:epidermal growth factor receptor pathway substrate 15 isoform X3 [Oratosquilla oratoria]|uniref:epidermal growth factor receptor pathway substrate 15 isoform X3 n=1 Tax=Oratosquilla oratoria TaxID=337810 RepID=UPI003F769520
MASLPSPTQVAGEQLSLFEAWYKKLDPGNAGSIQAGPAAGFLKKSGLNDNVLSRIWDMSDPGGRGYLDKGGFFVSLKLVALVQNGREPSVANVLAPVPPPNMGEPPPHPPPPKSPHPPAVPPAPSAACRAAAGVGQAPAPAATPSTVWTITPNDRNRYDQIFNSLGPEANKIHGNKVRGVMVNSKLPLDILGKIWDLADMDKDGSLDRVEFSIAMHLVYKVLENNTLPNALPPEMLSSARRAGVPQGAVPALAPPGQNPPATTPSTPAQGNQSSGPPPAPWVVSAAEKARYDVMFQSADIDKDGYVSGIEIKGVFLQSGLPQMVLAHIWNLCDMKQTGKLASEQFALAMWLIQQKLAGVDPPATLTPEMVPPTMRPKPSGDVSNVDLLGDMVKEVVPAKPQYSNPELQMVADEIEELNADKLKLESEIQQKEASIRVKNNEIKNLQTELDTLTATLRQLENQKGEAQKRLDDLGNQVNKLRTQVEEQESSLKTQEDEVMCKRQELNALKNQEMELEESVNRTRKRIEQLGVTQQDTQLHISQAKMKISDLQELERNMTELLTSYDSAISSGDASSLSEASLRDVTPTFADAQYLHIGPAPPTPQESPKEEEPPQQNGTSDSNDDSTISKPKDTSFSGAHDPFASAFGGTKNNVDLFGGWDSSNNPTSNNPTPTPSGDPFGGDAFANQPKANDPFGSEPFSGGPPPRPESPTPALPPKKAKQPPPRPAPPKTRPAKPPPPQINSNNNPSANKPQPASGETEGGNNANDPFGGGWGSTITNTNTNNGGFADFADFANFDNKCSSTNTSAESKLSPWGDMEDGTNTSFSSQFDSKLEEFKLDAPDGGDGGGTPAAATTTPSDLDPFSLPFKNAPKESSEPVENVFSSSVFTCNSDSVVGFSTDPFGGDYDPFSDDAFKEADKFSWDDEPDPFAASINADDPNLNLTSSKTDPFGGSFPDDNCKLGTETTSGAVKTGFAFDDFEGTDNNKNIWNRSKSALGDPFALQAKKSMPVRSKTALDNPGGFDFDPLSTTKGLNKEQNQWKSNEDLLNENLTWGSNLVSSSQNKPKSNMLFNKVISEDEQLAWAAKESLRLEEERKHQEEQENADLELALTLSKNYGHSADTQTRNSDTFIPSSRSPSTGL